MPMLRQGGIKIPPADEIPGVELNSLSAIPDERGRFTEISRFAHVDTPFVQANHSHSRRGVLRGLHYHVKQTDLFYVVRGVAQVGLVDLRSRRDPPLAASVELSDAEPATLLIPNGVAHGFLALTDVDLVYLVTREYDPADEHGIAWNDPQLDIGWKNDKPLVSDRDASNPELVWDQIPEF
jgi:dTDP-4-dehydrorhamnose 3,5-epimerase